MRLVAAVARELVLALTIFLATTSLLYFLVDLGTRPSGVRFGETMERYVGWLMGVVSSGNFGPSAKSNQYVADIISGGSSVTFTLVAGAIVVGLLVSVPLGAYCALRPDSKTGNALMHLLTGLSSLPVFLLGVFMLRLHGTFGLLLDVDSASFTAKIAQYVIPVAILGIADRAAAEMAKQVQEAIAFEVRENFIRAAVARRASIAIHLGRALLPQFLSMITSRFVYTLGAALVVEYIFFREGLSQAALDALRGGGDPAVVLAIGVIFSAVILVGTFITRTALLLVDPRTRLGHGD